LVYLDSAATSRNRPAVIDAMDDYYRRYNANPHRGVYAISEKRPPLTVARHRVATFINAASPKEVIFTRNTTEAINLVRYSWGRANVRAGDRILLTRGAPPHLVPWQLLAQEVGPRSSFSASTISGCCARRTCERSSMESGCWRSPISRTRWNDQPDQGDRRGGPPSRRAVLIDGARRCRTCRSTSGDLGSTSTPLAATRVRARDRRAWPAGRARSHARLPRGET